MEMKKLHAEWFPIEYPQSFYDRMNKVNVVAIGCFYRVTVSADCGGEANATEDKNQSLDTSSLLFESVLIGCIFARVENENERN